ncbi:MAG: M48 family metallopeptidase [Alphaproteobacteria bacterium]|nr:M48 family metallopeptidase [Alphaproteobacteria bacterium]MBU1280714.1 M48 family metallopeptidase [Alphaproteobacteria bacterium]MBU1572725.1 M48 family metallopeptidase [Alphaproteobacteria bacterium]MBU1827504.1 M48 family metallopeptidase [Alphaproteobacteria bacterium]MBU2077307.1 M48 family metallopeptidase [Alphaproteobacteria bacterium]
MVNTEQHIIGGTPVEVRWKAIKNLHVGVYPPEGKVRVAAPLSVSLDAVKLAVLTRMEWVRRKQAQFLAQERQTRRQYVSGETHFVFGKRLRLDVVQWEKKVHRIEVVGSDRLRFSVPPDTTSADQRRWLENWYKARLREHAAPRLAHWSSRLDVVPETWGIRPMKTKWGSCNPDKKIVWLNLELAKKPVRAIDYVLLHELAHLISPRHDDRFIQLLDENMPKWRSVRDELNRYPLAAWGDLQPVSQ